MEKAVQLHRRLAPELIELIEERFIILRTLQNSQPIGRRALAAALQSGERVVRAQVDFLKQAGLIDFTPVGMTVTPEGEAVLTEAGEYIRFVHGLTGLENELTAALGLERVIIIPGDSAEDDAVLRDMGRAAAGVLAQSLGHNMTVAASGGSTVAAVAEAVNASAPTVTVVPARGGLGERVDYQANTIAAAIASRLGGKYRLLHIPDGISEAAIGVIMEQDPNAQALAERIRRADILIHGIGRADEMARRRGLEDHLLQLLRDRGAVGEALGHYCTLGGEIVYATTSIGLKLDDLAVIRTVIAVAGGKTKAAAVVAVSHAAARGVLVTDEACAREIRAIIKKSESRQEEGTF